MKLPPTVQIVRETAVPPGWFAYYLDVADRALHMMPVILWVTVEYDELVMVDGSTEEWDTTQEIRPFVMSRPGRIVDAQEPELTFLTILGPGMDHIVHVRKFVKANYPDFVWPGDEPLAVSAGN